MKKPFSLLLCLCLSVFSFSSCSSFAPGMTEDEFERQVEIYRNRIKNADPSFEIGDESTLIYQNGMCTVLYSISSTSMDIALSVRFLFINTKKARINIVFYKASTDNAEVYASLIKAVTNSGLSYEKIRDSIKMMEKETSYTLNLNSCFEWENHHTDLYYREDCRLNIDS